MDTPISRRTRMQRHRKTLLVCAALLATVATAAVALNHLVTPSLRRDEIRLATVQPGSIANTVNASGVVIPTHEEQIPSPVASRITRVLAKPGQQVARGDLLLQLDDQSLRLAIDNMKEQIAQQENRILGLQQEMAHALKQRHSEIELAELDLKSAEVKLARYQKTGALGLTSIVDLQAVELVVQRSRIQLRQLRDSIQDTRNSTYTNIQTTQLQKSIFLKQLAQQQSLQAQTQVRAPFAGIVSWLQTDEGASVSNGQMVAKVSELHNYRVEASVSDFYARFLSPGLAVRVENNGHTLSGKVHTILPEMTGGTVKIIISLDQPDNPQLRDKLRVEAAIITEQKARVLVAETGPAISGHGRQDLFLLPAPGAEMAILQSVEIGLSDGKAVEILRGAPAGSQLIVSDTSRFKHLKEIRIRP